MPSHAVFAGPATASPSAVSGTACAALAMIIYLLPSSSTKQGRINIVHFQTYRFAVRAFRLIGYHHQLSSHHIIVTLAVRIQTQSYINIVFSVHIFDIRCPDAVGIPDVADVQPPGFVMACPMICQCTISLEWEMGIAGKYWKLEFTTSSLSL